MRASPPVNRRAALATLALLAAVAAPGLASADPVTIVALGDSLVAGYGLDPDDAFPVRLQAALAERGHEVTIVNAGVSGDTSAGGLARLDWALGPDVDGVIVELGANDALRGLTPAQTSENLDALLADLAERNLPVLLAGMLAPRNLGADYTRAFDAIYPDLADRHGSILYPFFLDGVAADAALNQDDGIHPTRAGVDIIVERMLPFAERLIGAAEARGAAGD